MAFVKDIDSAVSALTQQVEILKKKADDAMPSPMKMEKMPSLTSRTYSTASGWKVASYYNGREPNTTEEVDKILKDALESIETDMKRIEEVHEKNKPAIENNKQIRERVELIMKGVLGIPDTYRTYEYKTKRSSKPTEVSHRAGYIGDLERNIPIHDGYEDAKRILNGSLTTFNNIAKKMKEDIIKKEAEKNREELENKEVLAKARMQVKYGLDIDSDWEDILDAMGNECKYFRLAKAMEDTRNDWNDGYYLVENALNRFQIETEVDEELFEEIYKLATDTEWIDGRVFRDCKYNYGVLYDMANQEVYEDYQFVKTYHKEAW